MSARTRKRQVENYRYQEEMLMTRKIAAGCFAAIFGLAVSAGAQTPSTPQTPQPSTPSTPSSPSTPSTPSSPTASPTNPYPSSQSADRAGKESKITGCVQAGTSASSFELTNVKKGMSDSPSASAAPAAADAASKNVKLTAASGVDLAAHVGHTVEVTGSWAKSGDTGAAASPSASAPGASASAGGAKEFTVKNVKMVSSTCSAGTN
jgi:hypothetical protein